MIIVNFLDFFFRFFKYLIVPYKAKCQALPLLFSSYLDFWPFLVSYRTSKKVFCKYGSKKFLEPDRKKR